MLWHRYELAWFRSNCQLDDLGRGRLPITFHSRVWKPCCGVLLLCRVRSIAINRRCQQGHPYECNRPLLQRQWIGLDHFVPRNVDSSSFLKGDNTMVDRRDERQLDLFDYLPATNCGVYTAPALARQYGLSLGQALALLTIHGTGRRKLDAVLASQSNE